MAIDFPSSFFLFPQSGRENGLWMQRDGIGWGNEMVRRSGDTLLRIRIGPPAVPVKGGGGGMAFFSRLLFLFFGKVPVGVDLNNGVHGKCWEEEVISGRPYFFFSERPFGNMRGGFRRRFPSHFVGSKKEMYTKDVFCTRHPTILFLSSSFLSFFVLVNLASSEGRKTIRLWTRHKG